VEKDRKKQVAKFLEESRKVPKPEVKVDPAATAGCKFCGQQFKLVENKKRSCMSEAFHTAGAEEKKSGDRLMTCRWCRHHFYLSENGPKACVGGPHRATEQDEKNKKADDQKVARAQAKEQAATFRQRFPRPVKAED